MKFLDSFYKPQFYAENKLTAKGALKRVFFIYLCVGILFAIGFYSLIGRHIPSQIQKISDQVMSGYPNDLVVTFNNEGMISSQADTVRLFPITEKGKTQYVVTIQGSAAGDIPRDELTQSLFIFSKKEMMTQKGSGEIQIMPYKEISNFVMNKQVLLSLQSYLTPYIPYVSPVITLCIIVFTTIFAPIGFFIWAIFMALILMLVSKPLLKKELTYGESYLVSLYVGIIPVIIKTILTLTPYGKMLIIPFFGTLVTLLLTRYFYVEGVRGGMKGKE